MARKITYQQAINEALDQEMARDQNVIVLGEDVAGGSGAPGEQDAWGGVLGVTKGLYPQFPDRVLDAPLSEVGYVGMAVGAAPRQGNRVPRVSCRRGGQRGGKKRCASKRRPDPMRLAMPYGQQGDATPAR